MIIFVSIFSIVFPTFCYILFKLFNAFFSHTYLKHSYHRPNQQLLEIKKD